MYSVLWHGCVLTDPDNLHHSNLVAALPHLPQRAKPSQHFISSGSDQAKQTLCVVLLF